jgi:mRNA-degrading endonuclease toxin of MazEF toxin-antitoxin module
MQEADAFQIRSVSQARSVNHIGNIPKVHIEVILSVIQTVTGA